MMKGVATLILALGMLTYYYLFTVDQYCIRKATFGKNQVGVKGKPLLPFTLDKCASIHTRQFIKMISSPGQMLQGNGDDGKSGENSVQSNKGVGQCGGEIGISGASSSSDGRNITAIPFQQKAGNNQNANPEQNNVQSRASEIDHSSPEFVDDNTYYNWGDDFGRNKQGVVICRY